MKMKISDLISELVSIQCDFGDLECQVLDFDDLSGQLNSVPVSIMISADDNGKPVELIFLDAVTLDNIMNEDDDSEEDDKILN